MNDLFIKAAKNKFRFPAVIGGNGITVEDLFQLPLTGNSGLNLDQVAREVNRQLKEQTEESFVQVRKSATKTLLENKLDIVKTVIQIKQDDLDRASKNAERAAKRLKLMEAIDNADNRELQSASKEELLKQLEALEV